MAVQLREPFFLQGSTSVLERAIRMSLVLGAISGAAGWILTIVTSFYELADWNVSLFVFIPAAWSICATVVICSAINFWNRRSPLWTLLAAPANYLSIYLLMTCWKNGPASYGVFFQLWPGHLAVAAFSGLLLVRLSRSHALAYALSMIRSPLPLVVHYLLPNPLQRFGWLIPWRPWLMDHISIYAPYYMVWFAAIYVPWGVPFWWPPEADDTPRELA